MVIFDIIMELYLFDKYKTIFDMIHLIVVPCHEWNENMETPNNVYTDEDLPVVIKLASVAI